MNEFEILNEKTDGEEYLEFDLVENKFSSRMDVHAFILLDKLFPDNTSDIICWATRGEIYLNINDDDINSISAEDALTLTRCGVRYSGEHGCLCMFV